MRVGFHMPSPSATVLGQSGERGPFAPILIALNALTEINVWILQQYREMGFPLPSIYSAKIRATNLRPHPYLKIHSDGPHYRPEGRKEEEWLNVEEIHKRGVADCEDLACARAAEYQSIGIPAVPCIRFAQHGNILLIHVLVLLPNGQIEDPSKVLGMKGTYQ